MKKLKNFMKYAALMVGCWALFITGAYLYLNRHLPNGTAAETKQPSVPYEKNVCEDTGLLVRFPDQSGLLIFLDFTGRQVMTAVIDDCREDSGESFGYPLDFTFDTDHDFIPGFIDRIGGITLTIDGQPLRYTGVQIVDMLSVSTDAPALRRDMVTATAQKISQVGLSYQDAVFLIEHSKTTLTILDCYQWGDYLDEMFMRFVLIN